MEKKIQSYVMTLTLIRQCSMLNLSEEFPYTIKYYSNFKILDPLFFELSRLHSHTQTHRHTDRQTDRPHGDEYSILAVYTVSIINITTVSLT